MFFETLQGGVTGMRVTRGGDGVEFNGILITVSDQTDQAKAFIGIKVAKSLLKELTGLIGELEENETSKMPRM